MKQLYCLVFLCLASLCTAQSNPEDAIPVFNLDDYYVEPKMTLSVGFRALTGPKLSFSGSPGVTSVVESIQGNGDVNATGIVRNYHDGFVARDQRTDAVDGKTNTWTYIDPRQLQTDGFLAMHNYSAQIMDNTNRSRDPGYSYGTELIASRDMGKIGSKVDWKIFAGLSINGIDTGVRDNVLATITTITDLYNMDGQTVPAAPYTAPSNNVAIDGTVTDNSVLIGQKPDSRTVTAVTNNTNVSNSWNLRGTYVTFRVGPTLTYSISDKFRVSFSAGPAFIYIGTIYSVEQTLLPDTADNIVTTVQDTGDDVLKGYYADASLEYVFTDRAGLYMGAFYQSNGEYSQDLTSQGSNYYTKLDLNSMQGLRAGLNYKF
ncbi:MAG: hypothetical protein KA257_02375 [Opitutaceae bacterium]|nr:hypothetical protein [Opitutaceae bacterium]